MDGMRLRAKTRTRIDDHGLGFFTIKRQCGRRSRGLAKRKTGHNPLVRADARIVNFRCRAETRCGLVVPFGSPEPLRNPCHTRITMTNTRTNATSSGRGFTSPPTPTTALKLQRAPVDNLPPSADGNCRPEILRDGDASNCRRDRQRDSRQTHGSWKESLSEPKSDIDARPRPEIVDGTRDQCPFDVFQKRQRARAGNYEHVTR